MVTHSGISYLIEANAPSRREPDRRLAEPVAIVGIAGLFPGVASLEAMWTRLTEDATSAVFPQARIEDPVIDLSRFGIPPSQARSMARVSKLVLHVVDQCLADGGYGARELPRDRTDVICGFLGATDRQLANALRVEGGAFAEEVRRELLTSDAMTSEADAAAVAEDLRRALERRIGASPHDRVGEMASTIPARVAAAFKLRGRTLALEAADATSFVALDAAVLSLRTHACDAAIVVAGQTIDGTYLRAALAAKKMIAERARPFDPEGRGFTLAEGVSAVLLKRLSSAVRDGDRVYASITGIALAHSPARGTFRYARETKDRAAVIAAACADAGVAPSSLDFVECHASGLGPEVSLELRALGEASAGTEKRFVVGSAKERFGHTLANGGLLSLSKVALALHKRTLLPGTELASSLVEDAPVRTVPRAQPWAAPAGSAPRRAGIGASSFTGTIGHLVLEEYDSMHARRTPSAKPATAPVAVVGLGACFADAPDAPALWANVWRMHDAIRPLPGHVFPRAAFHDPRGKGALRSYTELGSHVVVPDAPPASCRIPPRRFAEMDAAQRVALVVADEMLRSFGWPERPLPKGRGLVAVASTLALNGERRRDAISRLHEVEAALADSPAMRALDPGVRDEVCAAVRSRAFEELEMGASTLDANLASGVAAVIANELGIAGVPLAVEAACASSLAAFDLAVRGVASGAYDFAIAGGVELACNPRELVLCAALHLLSPTRITPFDVAADGFSPGEGCALFLLRRQIDAAADRDVELAVVRGVGASNDAKSLIAPDVEGQALAMQRAFEEAGFAPDTVQYVEAHGTGTEVGDQVEIRSIGRVYGSRTRVQPLAIASIKSMLGHTFAAAGAAGLANTILGMRAKTLPPSAWVTTLNPKLPLHEIPAYVNTRVMPWIASPGDVRRAAVSSFGTGGINYHVLLEEPVRR